MGKFYDQENCRRKADQHWEMAGLARQDGDGNDAARHTKEAQKWEQRRVEGGWDEQTGTR